MSLLLALLHQTIKPGPALNDLFQIGLPSVRLNSRITAGVVYGLATEANISMPGWSISNFLPHLALASQEIGSGQHQTSRTITLLQSSTPLLLARTSAAELRPAFAADVGWDAKAEAL